MSTLAPGLMLNSIIGKSLKQVITTPYEIYMCIRNTHIFFIQRFDLCRTCSKEISREWRNIQPILCLNCRYTELPTSYYSTKDKEDIEDFKIQRSPIETFEKDGVQIYKITAFQINLNFSKLLFLPMSRLNTFSKKIEYNLMIYQQDYNGQLHELVARPYGYEKLEKVQQLTLNRTILFDVQPSILAAFDKFVEFGLDPTDVVNPGTNFNRIHWLITNS